MKKTKPLSAVDAKKHALLLALSTNFGNASAACRQCDIDIQRHNYYMSSDEEYARQVEYFRGDKLLDYAKQARVKKIAQGDWNAIKHVLECGGVSPTIKNEVINKTTPTGFTIEIVK